MIDLREPRTPFFQEICVRLRKEREMRVMRKQLFLFCVGLIASFTGIVSFSRLLIQELVLSGFFQYVALLVSNRGDIMRYWQELGYSLLESLPVTESILVCMCSIAFMYFFQDVIQSLKRLTVSVRLSE